MNPAAVDLRTLIICVFLAVIGTALLFFVLRILFDLRRNHFR